MWVREGGLLLRYVTMFCLCTFLEREWACFAAFSAGWETDWGFGKWMAGVDMAALQQVNDDS